MEIEVTLKRTAIFRSEDFYGDKYMEEIDYNEFKDIIIGFLYDEPDEIISKLDFKKV